MWNRQPCFKPVGSHSGKLLQKHWTEGPEYMCSMICVQDIDDLQNFACKHKVDFVAASFVQSKEDVLFIRKILDDAGGRDVKIISKIENMVCPGYLALQRD